MTASTSSAIVVSGSSDIGSAAMERWLARGWCVAGTYRRSSTAVEALARQGARWLETDLDSAASIDRSAAQLRDTVWDVLMICPATMEPVCAFEAVDFGEWERSIALNFTRQMQFLHALLPSRRRGGAMPLVVLWAGPGTNNAPLNYSAEIVAKLSQIKMCELLDAEIPDCRFVIVGPGWVKTKIHDETIRAGARAGANFERTLTKLASDECTPMERVMEFLDWCLEQPRSVISGRNFSVVHDIWGEARLAEKLAASPDMFKMRRFLNDWKGEPR